MIPVFDHLQPTFEAAFARLLHPEESTDAASVGARVDQILGRIRATGDDALVELTRQFDDWPTASAANLEVPRADWEAAYRALDPDILGPLTRAADRIRRFHTAQMKSIADTRVDDPEGSTVELVVRPLDSVGVYVPGGTALYPSTVLMNVIPAKVAGVREVVIVSPAKKGMPAPIVLAAAHLAGADRLFSIGGAQAIGALAYGTATILKVAKIVGPGNAYVAEAKRRVFGLVGIDEIAGPSEVLILADGTADPRAVALDLLAQAEHDPRAAAIVITWDRVLADSVREALSLALSDLPRKEIAERAISNRGGIVITADRDSAIALANRYAPEHLGLAFAGAETCVDRIANAGAVFVGHFAPEALGDYNAGSNHVLPTNGSARFGSPLSVHDFVRRMNVLRISRKGLAHLGRDAATLARAEGLEAHARAIEAREGH